MKGSHWHVGRFPHLFSLLVRVPRPHLHRPSLCFVSSPSFPYQHAVAELARVAPATCHVCARGASLVQSPPRAVRTRKSTAPPSLPPPRPRHIRRHIPPFLARPPARGCVASRGLGAPPSGRLADGCGAPGPRTRRNLEAFRRRGTAGFQPTAARTAPSLMSGAAAAVHGSRVSEWDRGVFRSNWEQCITINAGSV